MCTKTTNKWESVYMFHRFMFDLWYESVHKLQWNHLKTENSSFVLFACANVSRLKLSKRRKKIYMVLLIVVASLHKHYTKHQ